jgi:hypothetical protein
LRSAAVITEAVGTKPKISGYYHATMGSPTISTLSRALSKHFAARRRGPPGKPVPAKVGCHSPCSFRMARLLPRGLRTVRRHKRSARLGGLAGLSASEAAGGIQRR